MCSQRKDPVLVRSGLHAQKGLPSDFFLRALLQQNGINVQEINYIDMETAQAGAAFLAGDLDAAVVWEP